MLPGHASCCPDRHACDSGTGSPRSLWSTAQSANAVPSEAKAVPTRKSSRTRISPATAMPLPILTHRLRPSGRSILATIRAAFLQRTLLDIRPCAPFHDHAPAAVACVPFYRVFWQGFDDVSCLADLHMSRLALNQRQTARGRRSQCGCRGWVSIRAEATHSLG